MCSTDCFGQLAWIFYNSLSNPKAPWPEPNDAFLQSWSWLLQSAGLVGSSWAKTGTPDGRTERLGWYRGSWLATGIPENDPVAVWSALVSLL